MTNSSEEPDRAITDDQLPEDLRPGGDNPLAEGLPPGETADLQDGKVADEMGQDAAPDEQDDAAD